MKPDEIAPTDDSAEHERAAAAPPEHASRGIRTLHVARRVLLFAVAMFVFILAIQLMKTGAKPLSARLSEGFFPFNNAVSTLGVGMVLAYLTLSGKPVAVLALTFFATGGISRLEAFTMLSGGRLGAAFIVLLVGFLYSRRGDHRRESLGMGILALSLTALVYVPGMMIGYGVLKSGALSHIDLTSGNVSSVVDLVWGPVVTWFGNVLPSPALVVVGVLLIIVAIKLLDRVLPEMDGERQARSNGSRLKRPWTMFLFGSVVTLITQSVSVSLTVLVPLAAKGYVKRGEAIPYIMGANVTTLADTLLFAIVVGNVVGIQIVLAEFIGVLTVTVLCLLFLYQPIQRLVVGLDEWVVSSHRRLTLFVVGLFVFPGLLMLSGVFIGHPLGH